MDKKTIFYGTPLSKSLASVIDNDVGPSSSRKFRLNQQQTVRDSQGRQRFHGAFTGGFSAGYFNTVDTAAGFQPKTFTSHRHRQSNYDSSSSFSHKPEDYMDEEDLGEFGIAPKKIRVSKQFVGNDSKLSSKSSRSLNSTLHNLVQPSAISIGEKILNCMNGQPDYRIDRSRVEKVIEKKVQSKSDFHGLGYKPLIQRKTSDIDETARSNPLNAVLKKGKRLNISGEAFGSGVLEDDDDCLPTNDLYGYDDMRNYTFDPSTKVLSQRQQSSAVQLDSISIPGFVPSSNGDKLSSLSSDACCERYPPLEVPCDWKEPTRPEPQVQLTREQIRLYKDIKDVGSLMSKKFTTGTEKYQTTGSDSKSGLLQYSDLKASEPTIDTYSSSDTSIESANVTRQILEWRPCSLLCKRFNVPNPFPDQSAVGVVYSGEPTSQPTEQGDLPCKEPASLEFKQSIFDVILCNDQPSVDDDHLPYSSHDDEDEPLVVESSDPIVCHGDDGSDEDVEVVIMPKPEPELIVLSSSSSPDSSKSPSTPPRSQIERKCDISNYKLGEADDYGPPLPPTLKALIELDHRHHGDSKSDRKHRKKKSKKHKRHKRND